MKAAFARASMARRASLSRTLPSRLAGPGEVLIRVRAAALNFFDTLITRGKYQTKPGLPFSPSGEVAGIVEGVGPGVSGP